VIVLTHKIEKLEIIYKAPLLFSRKIESSLFQINAETLANPVYLIYFLSLTLTLILISNRNIQIKYTWMNIA